jgi:hypothetical protein
MGQYWVDPLLIKYYFYSIYGMVCFSPLASENYFSSFTTHTCFVPLASFVCFWSFVGRYYFNPLFSKPLWPSYMLKTNLFQEDRIICKHLKMNIVLNFNKLFIIKNKLHPAWHSHTPLIIHFINKITISADIVGLWWNVHNRTLRTNSFNLFFFSYFIIWFQREMHVLPQDVDCISEWNYAKYFCQ